MSDGKYLINKSSLTGIADAVRDKLGVGEATTDPQTGDIVYPEGKGYYIGDGEVEVIAAPNGSGTAHGRGTSSSAAWTPKQIINIPFDAYSQRIEKPFYQLEVQGCFYSTLSYNTLGYADFSLQTSTTDETRIELQNDNTILQKVTKNFDSAQDNLYIQLHMVINTYSSESYYYTRFKVILKDENGVPIKLISSGFPYRFNGSTCTMETISQSGIKKPIPYSISDITNNIEDYWSIPEGSLNISANGTYDVTNKAEAVVNVPNPSTGSLEITENGTYDVTDKASAVVNVPTGGGGGGTAPIPRSFGFDRQGYQSKYVNLHDYISTVQNEQDVMAALLDMYCSDASMLAVKPTGGFYSYKQLGWANPSPSISGLTAAQIADAYDNNRMIPLIKYSGLSMNQNQLYVVIVGTKIYFCYNTGGYSMNWCYILTALY